MELTREQVKFYNDNGFLLLDSVFTKKETTAMLEEMYKVIAEECPRRILEKTGVVRSFFAPERSSLLFDEIVRNQKLVLSSAQLLDTDVYVHQTKLNTKHAMVGDWWEWHQDYTFWKNDDGMPSPDVLTVMIFLNDVNEFNGPLLLIPGSHKAGVLDEENNDDQCNEVDDDLFVQYKKSTSYMSALTADLKYSLKQPTVDYWVKKRGIFSAKGTAGSILFFHGNVFHASYNNISPWDRHTFLITYNSVKNVLADVYNPRPDFIANRNFEAIIPRLTLKGLS